MALSKASLCNISLSYLGDYEVNNIDTPSSDIERICSIHYTISLEAALRDMIANFSIKRRYFNLNTDYDEFGWGYAYAMPNDCIKVLGIGETQEGVFDSYSVEGGHILVDEEYTDGLPVRYISNDVDINDWDTSFIKYFAMRLAVDMCMDITHDLQKYQLLDSKRQELEARCASVNLQENRPVIVNRSKYKDSRSMGNYPRSRYKN